MQIMPRHAQPVHPRSPSYAVHNQAPRLRGRHIAAIGGAVLLAGVVSGAALIGIGGGEKTSNNDAGPITGDRPTATATQFPDLSQTPQATISPSETSGDTTSTTPAPTPTDIYLAVRQAAARRANSCNLSGFTNEGRSNGQDNLRVELLYENNVVSQDARSHGKSDKLTWSDPRVVLVPLDAQGQPSQKGVRTLQPSGDTMPRHFTLGLPDNAAAHTTYLVGVETDASTPLHGGTETTVDVVYCGGIENTGNNHNTDWRSPEQTVNLPDLYSTDIFRP